MDIKQLALFILFFFLASIFLTIAIKMYKYDSREFKKNVARSKSIWDIIVGKLVISNDHLPDGRVQAGINYNRKKKRIEVTGKLSDDKIEEILSK